jgi:hypothetical protein
MASPESDSLSLEATGHQLGSSINTSEYRMVDYSKNGTRRMYRSLEVNADTSVTAGYNSGRIYSIKTKYHTLEGFNAVRDMIYSIYGDLVWEQYDIISFTTTDNIYICLSLVPESMTRDYIGYLEITDKNLKRLR